MDTLTVCFHGNSKPSGVEDEAKPTLQWVSCFSGPFSKHTALTLVFSRL